MSRLEEYLSRMPGAVRDYKEEWNWHRRQSYDLVFSKLTKKMQKEILGGSPASSSL